MRHALKINLGQYKRRLAALGGAALLVVGTMAWCALGPVAAAVADPLAECSTTSGVIVAVDFSAWGGNVERGCGATLSTGYAALQAAGFTTAGDTQDGPAFICRIDDEPPPSQDPCIDTPPASAYWAYWHADAGQNSWTPSELGAMSYHPQPGSVDAWTFGKMTAPVFTPSEVRATNAGVPLPSTTTTTTVRVTTTTAPAHTSPGVGTSAPQSVPAPSAPVALPKTAPASATTTAPARSRQMTTKATSPDKPSFEPAAAVAKGVPTSTSPGDESPAAPGAGGGRPAPGTAKIVDVAPVAAGQSSPKGAGGSDAGALIGVPVVLVIGGAGLATAWRRRRRAT